jgi:cytochrome c oxidase subunit 2
VRIALVFALTGAGLIGCGTAPAVRVDAIDVRLVAENTSWHASYVLPARSGATTAVPTGREVHVPLGADVRLALTSRDYISDFTLPQLGLRDFAAPDLPSEFRFHADRVGRYDVRGDELCGRPHTDKTRGVLVVEDAASFRAWIRKRTQGSDQ